MRRALFGFGTKPPPSVPVPGATALSLASTPDPLMERYEFLRTLRESIYGKVKLARGEHTAGRAQGGHPHVLRLLFDFEWNGWHFQVLEFCRRGELFDVVDAHSGKSGIGIVFWCEFEWRSLR